MDGQIQRQNDKQTDRKIDGQTEECCISTVNPPSGAAVQSQRERRLERNSANEKKTGKIRLDLP